MDLLLSSLSTDSSESAKVAIALDLFAIRTQQYLIANVSQDFNDLGADSENNEDYNEDDDDDDNDDDASDDEEEEEEEGSSSGDE